MKITELGINFTWCKLSQLLAKYHSSKHIKISLRSISFCQTKFLKEKYINPIDRIQPFCQVKILPEKEFLFLPTPTEVFRCQELFKSTYARKITCTNSSIDAKNLKEDPTPEVAFLGRSNVGKSSLIRQMFFEDENLEHKLTVSKTPGHTKSLRFYRAGKDFTLVDMPGYGYNMPDHFEQSVEEYLKMRRKLIRTFVLIDGETGIVKSDMIGLDMMEEMYSPYVLVLTKIDKVSLHKLLKNLQSLLQYRDEHTHYCSQQVFLVSSKTGEGIPLLQSFVAYVTGNFIPD